MQDDTSNPMCSEAEPIHCGTGRTMASFSAGSSWPVRPRVAKELALLVSPSRAVGLHAWGPALCVEVSVAPVGGFVQLPLCGSIEYVLCRCAVHHLEPSQMTQKWPSQKR